jgi:hypothetical protein
MSAINPRRATGSDLLRHIAATLRDARHHSRQAESVLVEVYGRTAVGSRNTLCDALHAADMMIEQLLAIGADAKAKGKEDHVVGKAVMAARSAMIAEATARQPASRQDGSAT